MVLRIRFGMVAPFKISQETDMNLILYITMTIPENQIAYAIYEETELGSGVEETSTVALNSVVRFLLKIEIIRSVELSLNYFIS